MARVDWEPGWFTKIDKEVDNFMEKIAEDVYDTMMVKVPVKTGALKADLDWEYNKTTKTARIGARSLPYAIWVEEGTHPHRIDTDSKKALAWKDGRHPVNHVNHPGATASNFMKESLYMERVA
jgi:hypothetical protein